MRWGLKEAWSKHTGQWTKTGYRGLRRWTTEQAIQKSIFIKNAGGKFRWSRVEGCRAYFGRSARCHGFVTERGTSDRRAEVSSGQSNPDLWMKAQTVPSDEEGKGQGK